MSKYIEGIFKNCVDIQQKPQSFRNVTFFVADQLDLKCTEIFRELK